MIDTKEKCSILQRYDTSHISFDLQAGLDLRYIPKITISNIEQSFKAEKYSFNKALFDYKHVIGRGGFGKVWKVELKRNKKIYAMK